MISGQAPSKLLTIVGYSINFLILSLSESTSRVEFEFKYFQIVIILKGKYENVDFVINNQTPKYWKNVSIKCPSGINLMASMQHAV